MGIRQSLLSIRNQLNMTTTIELGKAEFWTIEAFQFEYEDECFYEEDRCEDVDTYWYEGMGNTLEEYFREVCNDNLTEDDHVMVSLIPRRWATIVDGEVTDYGDDCLGIETYIWNGSELMTQEEYINDQCDS